MINQKFDLLTNSVVHMCGFFSSNWNIAFISKCVVICVVGS